MDEVEGQRATREAKAQARARQYAGRLSLLGYLTAESYVTAHEIEQGEPTGDGQRPKPSVTRDN